MFNKLFKFKPSITSNSEHKSIKNGFNEHSNFDFALIDCDRSLSHSVSFKKPLGSEEVRNKDKKREDSFNQDECLLEQICRAPIDERSAKGMFSRFSKRKSVYLEKLGIRFSNVFHGS